MRTTLFALSLASITTVCSAKADSVVIVQNDLKNYELLVDGLPYYVNGVGGTQNLELFKELGGNTIRTWGIDQLEAEVNGTPILDYFHELGLKVVAGIWVEHERHGFDYSDPAQIKDQRAIIRGAVKKYKEHPAILFWGLGNEMEDPTIPGVNKKVLLEVNELAKIVKQEDPNHPVMTVIAGLGRDKAAQIEKYCPEIDLLGINSYAGATSVAADIARQGWKKPFMLTEFGPFGHWEVKKTSWGAPIEPNSNDKAASYLSAHESVVEGGKGQCLGTFAFYWGEKQECTATWFGMFLSTGERLGTVDVMSYAWTGNFPKNRSPQLHSLNSTAAFKRISPQSKQTACVEADDPDGDALIYHWAVVAESTDQKVGGDAERRPPAFPELIQSKIENKVSFIAPEKSGAYRLFVYIKDDANCAATANVPFYVN